VAVESPQQTPKNGSPVSRFPSNILAWNCPDCACNNPCLPWRFGFFFLTWKPLAPRTPGRALPTCGRKALCNRPPPYEPIGIESAWAGIPWARSKSRYPPASPPPPEHPLYKGPGRRVSNFRAKVGKSPMRGIRGRASVILSNRRAGLQKQCLSPPAGRQKIWYEPESITAFVADPMREGNGCARLTPKRPFGDLGQNKPGRQAKRPAGRSSHKSKSIKILQAASMNGSKKGKGARLRRPAPNPARHRRACIGNDPSAPARNRLYEVSGANQKVRKAYLGKHEVPGGW